jgi:hypothetical protein
MKQCPKCHYCNKEDDLKCQKCDYIFKLKTNNKREIENKENDWPSDEWKDWNLK